jgi:hypothetical protein
METDYLKRGSQKDKSNGVEIEDDNVTSESSGGL